MRQEVRDSIKTLSELDLSKYPYNEILAELSNIGFISHLCITLHPVKPIFRARLNDPNKHFCSKCELTYKPEHSNEKCQRASTPKMTMFYGSILPEEIPVGELDITRATPSYEAVPWLRDKSTKGKKTITYSKWHVTNDIRLIAILQHGNFYDKSSYTKKLMDDFNNFLKENINLQEETIAFATFLANEFAKEVDSTTDYNYLISAAFTKSIVDKGYDGVLYPSVRLDGTGFNVALIPQVADTKLQLDVVVECSAYKLYEKTILDNDLQAILYPNQTYFALSKVDNEYHEGEEKCLKRLELCSIDDLK